MQKRITRILSKMTEINTQQADTRNMDQICLINQNYREIIRLLEIDTKKFIQKNGLLTRQNNGPS